MFEDEYRKRINKVVQHIEQNLAQKISLKELSQQAGISQFHLHRLFLVYTGETLGGFVRRNRLAAGYSQFQDNPESNVINAALSVGYDSVSSFIRSFKSRFGFTPKSSENYNQGTLALWKTQKSEARQIVSTPDRIEFRVASSVLGVDEYGYENRSFQKAAEKAFKRAIQLVSMHNLSEKIGKACAVMFDDPDLNSSMKIRYFGGFLWNSNEELSYEGLTQLRIKEGDYAVFTHKGPYTTLWQTWNTAYRNWLPNSEYDLDDAAPFEIYINDPRTVRSSKELITEIYIPLKRRS